MNRAKAFWIIAIICTTLFGGGLLLSVFFNIDYWHGVFCALAYGTTDGCDVNSPSPAGRWVAAIVILVNVPTLGYTISQITSGHIKAHLNLHHEEIKKLINENNTEEQNVEEDRGIR